MNRFTITLGDFSGDGHSIDETIIVESNRTVEEVRNIYYYAVKHTGFDFANTVCSEYENNSIDEILAEELENLGITISPDIEKYDDKYFIDTSNYLDLFKQFLQLEDPELTLNIIPSTLPELTFFGFLPAPDGEKSWHMGHLGYGLFV